MTVGNRFWLMRLVFSFFIILPFSGEAQQIPEKMAKNLLYEKVKKNGLTEDDINSSRISDMHYSPRNDAYFIYFQQMHNGIDIYNAIVPAAINDKNELFSSGEGFIANLSDKIVKRVEAITAEEALVKTLNELKIPSPKALKEFQKVRNNYFKLTAPEIALDDIIAEKVYFLQGDDLVLVWRIEIDSKFGGDYFSFFIDTEGGQVIEKFNHTLQCSFEKNSAGFETVSYPKGENSRKTKLSGSKKADGAQYRVYPYFIESPSHGDQELIINPADEIASPFGWHDTDGKEGAEQTITKGNNAHAFQDRDDDDQSDRDEPDGGEDLIFDFDHNELLDVVDNLDADVTQSFYMNNIMHDWTYHLGFDEAAGNYQINNLGRGTFDSKDKDPVEVNVLDGFDRGQLDNANFSITSDGRIGRMQLFNFQARGKDLFILSPENLQNSLLTGRATFGPGRVRTELEGKLVLANDNVDDVTDACEVIRNTESMLGNIALIRRGTCFFSEKVFNVQQFGAKAAIVCNNAPDQIIDMAGALNSDLVSIPAYFISKEDCEPIESALKAGANVTIKFVPNISRNISSSFDNGIVAHEYAHGISGRLTGGASRSGCLNNDEQMGEGWSDFFALVLTQQESDLGINPRGIGSYVQGQRPNGQGFRRFRYSTDIMVNPQTMDDIRGTAPSPHQLGEVWAQILWDMYWLFLEQYGYDATWKDKNSGNFKAMRIVMDGMKLQPCSPGFSQGRNAILEADRLNYDSENECLIWSAFARRGVGFNSDGGTNIDRDDNIEGYEVLPTCIKTLKIDRNVQKIASAGDIVKVTVTISNHTEDLVNNVLVKDQIPINSEFIEGSSNFPFTKSDDQNLNFSLANMSSLDEIELTYDLRLGINETSVNTTSDNFSQGTDLFADLEGSGQDNEWKPNTQASIFGTTSYNIIDDTLATGGSLTQITPLLLGQERPVFTFWHRYNTEFGYDGGILEISTDGGVTWSYISEDRFISNGYVVEMINNQFGLSTSPRAFTGNSKGFIQSFVDLSAFKGREILIRFRWASDANLGVSGLLSGWFIDFVEFMDLKEVEGLSCVNADGQPESCDSAGTILRSTETVSSTNDLLKTEFKIHIYPNPADDRLNLNYFIKEKEEFRLRIIDIGGSTHYTDKWTSYSGEYSKEIDVSFLPDGIYVLSFQISGQVYNQQFVKQGSN